ncbi:MAG: cytochrome ubiquinol oxidase subunit I, partial [Gammaproteobacteria bacterium]|nr:cytochrome ubiquinol oxidase subunit I [Gammaproteobacteria bacterium]
EKDIGLGVTLPLYVSGSKSVGWWAMLITMIGDMTAFASLIFGYFFYWTIHENFPPEPSQGPGLLWPAVAAAALTGAWLLTWFARAWNRRGRRARFHGALAAASLLGVSGACALLAGPWLAGLDPAEHVYPATVWVLALWAAAHVAAGVLMQLYCIARGLARRLTAEHDIDICNVALYWHFVEITAIVTVAVLALFPLVA